MLDVVEPIVLPEETPNSRQLVCPKCEASFSPNRSNQKFCSRPCSKAATRNTARGDRSSENKAMRTAHYDRAKWLAKRLYSAPPRERLGVMKDILEEAKDKKLGAGLRRVLSDPKLLKAHPVSERRLFHRGYEKTIAQAASAYTQMFFGVGIQTYLKQVREGALNEKHPVSPPVCHGSAPRLHPVKKVKCWHKPLKPKPIPSDGPCSEAP